jgi:hypothetical protein
MPVYEVVDGADWSEEQVEPISVMDLTEAIEREVAGTLNAPTD